MHAVLSRGLAVAAASASLGAVLITPAISYADDPPASPTPVATATPVDPVAAALALIAGDDTSGLAASLAALTPAQVRTLLDSVSTGDLATVVGLLSPAQISDLAGFAPAITGLQAVITGFGSAPSAAQVDALVAQVNALLGATPIKDIAGLNGLLTQFAPLLTTPGLDATGLAALWQAIVPIAVTADPPSAIKTILTVLVTGSTVAPVPTAVPTVAPVVTPEVTAPAFSAYRVKVVRVKRSADGRHAYIVLRAPASVKRAVATVSGSVGDRTAFATRRVVLTGRASKVVTVKLARGTGTFKVVATTRGSSLPPSTQRAAL